MLEKCYRNTKIPFWIIPYTSFLPSIFAIITILSCYKIAENNHHIPTWLWAPQISLLGCQDTEQIIYQIGFGTTGISVIIFYYSFSDMILKYILPNEFVSEKSIMLKTILFCAIGVFGQGIITMDIDALQTLANPESIPKDWKPSTQSTIHQLLAAVFFMAAMYHGIQTLNVYYRCNAPIIQQLYISKYIKTFLLCIPFLFQIFAFYFHPISSGTKSHDELIVAGISQYLTVGSYLLFFVSYGFDYWKLKNYQESVKETKVD